MRILMVIIDSVQAINVYSHKYKRSYLKVGSTFYIESKSDVDTRFPILIPELRPEVAEGLEREFNAAYGQS